MHRRLATAIEAREPDSADQNAALIAEHLEAAGDSRDAYGWHMRAAAWATYRDLATARLAWESAARIADALPEDEPYRTAMCIARAPCCAGSAGGCMCTMSAIASRSCGSCAAPRGQGVAGHCDGWAGGGPHLPGPRAGGVAAGFRSHHPHRVHRRSNLDGGAVLHSDPREDGQRRVVRDAPPLTESH